MIILRDQKTRRKIRIRKKLVQNLGLSRLTIYRSNCHIWAQIIDDKKAKTLVAFSSKSLTKEKGTKVEIAKLVGQGIAKLAIEKNIKRVKFDRGSYRYHGRVKALADGARAQGLIL